MIQRLTSKRRSRQAHFRSLLMVGLLAGGACAPLASLSAQTPGVPAELTGMPPSLEYVPNVGQPLPNVDGALNILPAVPSVPAMPSVPRAVRPVATARNVAVRAPLHLVRLLGLDHGRGIASAVQTIQAPVPSQVRQVQYDSKATGRSETCVRASQASRDGAAGVVAHAYLTESNTAGLQGNGRAVLRPLSGAPVDGDSAAVETKPCQQSTTSPNAATGPVIDAAQGGDVPVLGGPVRFDAALVHTPANAPVEVAPAKEPEESESLLDLDLSSLTAQGPGNAAPSPTAVPPSSNVSLLQERSSPKLIATESGALNGSLPLTRAPGLTLSDSSPAERAQQRTPTPIKAHLVSAITRPTRVDIHESFAPHSTADSQSFHLSDDDETSDLGQAPKLAEEHQRVVTGPAEPLQLDDDRPYNELHEPVQSYRLAAERKPAEDGKVVAANVATAVAPAPALLPSTPALLGQSEPKAESAAAASEVPPAVPYVPGTDGLVVKASRPGLGQREARRSQPPTAGPLATKSRDTEGLDAETLSLDAPASQSRTPEIARSSSQRPISLRIGGQDSSTARLELSDQNPIAITGPVVRAVKQATTIEPVAKPSTDSVLQSSDGPEHSSQSQLVQDLTKAIKKTFPSSRVELKADEEGLVAEGVAASESEAKKILAMVRKTALCPVADHIITKR